MCVNLFHNECAHRSQCVIVYDCQSLLPVFVYVPFYCYFLLEIFIARCGQKLNFPLDFIPMLL